MEEKGVQLQSKGLYLLSEQMTHCIVPKAPLA